ncbi:MAG: dephospho-CoA kinase [Alphaproteobacteria bacterium]|jgi:dephospho-CoA kinase|nr:dephospho-CoA kinase [Pseudomonadota bacterium]NBP48894.1 dephospho-CoA kinase [Alphaproteobacteria bacterium]MDA0959828.1 dephospho-CoA kinase [Pseudomonadota bacterium]MDA1151170.1 dephospho-CoA kinase [Pseudomonadota bacterium]NCW30326.1 dephospho-CoA kinase [Alphaproteobacteria bacterium]
MKIIGLTGSIAAGKSTVAGWVRDLGIAIHDADAAVHELLGPDGAAVADIIGVFGADTGSIATGIDRQALGNLVFANPPRRKQLEAILHPMVRQHRDAFIHRHRAAGAPAILLDVPLLFETGGEAICDYVIVVYASTATITQRALSRTGMTAAKLEAILASQMPVAEKKQRADLLLDTDLDQDATRQDLIRWLSAIDVPMVEAGKS